MPEQVNIGIIGAGGIFQHQHLPALTSMPDVTIESIANRSRESAQSVIDEFDIEAKALADPDGVLEDDTIDAVMVGTWPYKHHPYAMKALDEGKHVFVQARMARSLTEAKQMYERSQETDLVTQVCPEPFGMEPDPIVQDRVQSGDIGDLRFVRGYMIRGGRVDPSAAIRWRDIERYQGVNALQVGILIERLHRWVGHVSSVSARAETYIEERPSQDGSKMVPVELPDIVSITCEFENGAIGSLDFSELSPHPVDSRIELYGSQGSLVYNIDEGTLMEGDVDDAEASEVTLSDENTREWTVEADFVEAIRNGGHPRTTFFEGAKYIEFSEAIWRSIETGSEIELPLRTWG